MTKAKWEENLNINWEPTCSIISKYITGRKYGCLPENEKIFLDNEYQYLIKENLEKKSKECKRKDELCKLERLINFYLKGQYNKNEARQQSGSEFLSRSGIMNLVPTKYFNNLNENQNKNENHDQNQSFDNVFQSLQKKMQTQPQTRFHSNDHSKKEMVNHYQMNNMRLNNYIQSKLLNLYQTFYKPKKPTEWKLCEQKTRGCRNNWINNNNMLEILNQYMLLYENFLFLGVFYINFLFVNKRNINGVYCPLDRFDFSLMNKKKKNVCAMIFNTSSHGKKGEHWIAMVFFWKGHYGEINFFDSYGKSVISPLPDEILVYMKILYNLGLKHGIKFRCQKSKIIHQKKNGECGVYSLYFIVHSLNNSFDSIHDRISDENMKQYRNIFWRE